MSHRAVICQQRWGTQGVLSALAAEEGRCWAGASPGPAGLFLTWLPPAWFEGMLVCSVGRSVPAGSSCFTPGGCRCSPKRAAPGAGNQTGDTTESPRVLSSGFPASAGVIKPKTSNNPQRAA